MPGAPSAGSARRRPHVVAALMPDRKVSLLELAAAEQIFGDADGDLDEQRYELRLCGAVGRRGSGFGGLELEFAYGLEGLDGADTVIAMPWSGEEPPPEVLEALRAAHAARCPHGVVLHRGVRAGRGRPARRPPGDHALAGHR